MDGPTFPGFPSGPVVATPIPDCFFAELLPAISSLAEAKVTLHALWCLSRKRGPERFLAAAELERDGTLLRGLASEPAGPAAALRAGLDAALARGSLLGATVAGPDGPADVVVANSEAGRRALERLRAGAVALPRPPLAAVPPTERPTIFELYEQNVGLLSPILAEELAEAAQTYPAGWIEDAIRRAAIGNRRSWRYIRAILERWTTEGRDDRETTGRRPAAAGASARRRWEQTYRGGRR